MLTAAKRLAGGDRKLRCPQQMSCAFRVWDSFKPVRNLNAYLALAPNVSKLWPPAAAIMAASFARSCPRMRPMSTCCLPVTRPSAAVIPQVWSPASRKPRPHPNAAAKSTPTTPAPGPEPAGGTRLTRPRRPHLCGRRVSYCPDRASSSCVGVACLLKRFYAE